MKLDKIDRRILAALQKDAFLTGAELGKKVHLSGNTAWRRRNAMIERGVIRGAEIQVDPSAVWLNLTVYILVRVRHHTVQELKKLTDQLNRWDNVVEWASIIGSWDYLVKVMVRDPKEYAVFYQKLQAVDQVVQLRGLPAFGEPARKSLPLDTDPISVEDWPFGEPQDKVIKDGKRPPAKQAELPAAEPDDE